MRMHPADRLRDNWGTVLGIFGLVYAASLVAFVFVGPFVLVAVQDVPLDVALFRAAAVAAAAYLLLAAALLR